LEKKALSLAAARKMVAAAEAEAERNHWRGVVAIVERVWQGVHAHVPPRRAAWRELARALDREAEKVNHLITKTGAPCWWPDLPSTPYFCWRPCVWRRLVSLMSIAVTRASGSRSA
jgi:hypothetical protein